MRLFEPIDNASLAVFRMMFGAVMVWEAIRYLSSTWIERYWIEPGFFFHYYGFDWVRPWPGDGMYWHFIGLGVLGAFIAVGFLYRLSAVLFFLGFTYIFLLDQATYLNHFYLICLLGFLMIFVPAHTCWSVDAVLWKSGRRNSCPRWAQLLLWGQLGVVYVYAGVAKLNVDWLRGRPLDQWLAQSAEEQSGTWLGDLLSMDWAPLAFSYGGLLFDLFIFPALLWRRTRPVAFVVAMSFHYLNARLFHIGIFPLMMAGVTLYMLPPSWPRRLFRQSIPALDPIPERSRARRRLVMAGLALYFAIQLLVPLRHFLYPGNVHWTEEGHRFAWHMKLRDKSAMIEFRVIDPATGESRIIDPAEYLSERQLRKMPTRPDMILQFAHHLAEVGADGGPRLEVRARVYASLNGRDYDYLIDSAVDLAAQPRTLAHVDWIMPLREQRTLD